MRLYRRLFLVAAAAVAMAVSGNQAGAAYTYSTELVINSASSGGVITNTPGTGGNFLSTGGTLVQLQDILTPGAFLVGNQLSANIGNVAVGKLANATVDNFTVSYTDTITITNPVLAGGTGTFQIKGVMTFSGIQNDGTGTAGVVSNVYSPPLSVGPITITSPAQFTMTFGNGSVNDLFGVPTVLPISNITTSGNLGGVINSAVPEPTSMALIGIGLTGLLGYSWRRREVARRLAA